jgi:glycerol uptake operon antiterminator
MPGGAGCPTYNRSTAEEVSLALRPTPSPARPLAVDRSAGRLFEAFHRVPVIAVIRRAEDLPRALASRVPAIFFLRAPAFHLGPLVWAVQARGKMAFVHIDLIAGLGKDRAGVAFLAREIGVNGIVTSHGHLVAAARSDRVIAVQRLLLHDELGLSSALSAVERARPDIIEVLPGVIFPEIVAQLRERLTIPVIVGGFITDETRKAAALEAGAQAVTTSTPELWP